MPKHRLSDLYVKNVRSDKRTDIWDRDAPGLVLRVAPGGSKSWMFFYRFEGKFRKSKIGNAHELSLANARKKARELRDGVHAGKDPTTDPSSGHPATVSVLFDAFLERHCKRHKRTWREDERMMTAYVLPVIGARLIHQIEKKDVLGVVEGVAVGGVIGGKMFRGGLRMADRVLTLTRTMFGWAIAEGLAQTDPTAGIRRRNKKPPRNRMLSVTEIHELWDKLPEIYPDEPRQLVMRLLLATGQRRGEVLNAERSELHLAGVGSVWLIPSARTKNGREHLVPLSPLAADIWRRALDISADERLIFPAVNGERIFPDTITKPLARAFKLHASRLRQPNGKYIRAPRPRLLMCPEFIPHDLRRTAASHMARLGVDRTVIGKTLNHISADRLSITGFVYDQHDYLEEKRAALNKWATEIQRLIRPAEPAE